jgi:hypothetical protein
MNPSLPSMPISNVPWPTSDQSDRSSEAAPEAAVLVMNAGHADQDHTGHGGADEALQTADHALRQAQAEWAEGVRDSVRHRPLTAVAAAFALGALLVRIAR